MIRLNHLSSSNDYVHNVIFSYSSSSVYLFNIDIYISIANYKNYLLLKLIHTSNQYNNSIESTSNNTGNKLHSQYITYRVNSSEFNNNTIAMSTSNSKPPRNYASNTANNLSASLNIDSISNDNRAPQNTKYRVKDVVDLTNDNSVVQQLYPVFNKNAPTGSQYQEKDIHAERSNVFGHNKFRAGQEEVIVEAMAGSDIFVLMPTGGGKSLCYQLPAWCSFGLSVIISPLISLIEDQVDAMNGIGIKAVFLNSTTPQQHIISELQNPALNGGIKEKLYRSELVNGLVKDLCSRGMVSRFVVDEVHCLSEW